MFDFGIIIFLLHLAVTIFFAGIIWFVQIVHYPLLAYIGKSEIVNYEKKHNKTVMLPAKIIMSLELITGLLLFWFHPEGITNLQVILGLILIAFIWYQTWFVQVPCHKILCQAVNPQTLSRLLKTNLLRTLACTLRITLVLWMLLSILNIKAGH